MFSLSRILKKKNKDNSKLRYFEIHESHKLSSHENYLRCTHTNSIFIKVKRNLEFRRFRSIVDGSLKITIEEISCGKSRGLDTFDHVQSYKKKKEKKKGKKRKEKKRR